MDRVWTKVAVILIIPKAIFVSFQDKDINLSGEHVREGLTCIISVKVPNPEFEGQTKVPFIYRRSTYALANFLLVLSPSSPLVANIAHCWLFCLSLKDKVGKSGGAKSG